MQTPARSSSRFGFSGWPGRLVVRAAEPHEAGRGRSATPHLDAFLGLRVFRLFLIARVDDSLAHIAFSWLFWANFLFGAMVVLRRLGLFCHRRKVVLDWFPDRPTWGR